MGLQLVTKEIGDEALGLTFTFSKWQLSKFQELKWFIHEDLSLLSGAERNFCSCPIPKPSLFRNRCSTSIWATVTGGGRGLSTSHRHPCLQTWPGPTAVPCGCWRLLNFGAKQQAFFWGVTEPSCLPSLRNSTQHTCGSNLFQRWH